VQAQTLYGSSIFVDARDVVGRYIYLFGIWEPNLTHWLRQSLKPGDTFIDVGANVGYYSLLASKLVTGSGKVVSVEALPETFHWLEKNLRTNLASNVRAVNVAAWHEHDNLKIFSNPGGTSGTTTVMQTWAAQWNLAPDYSVPARPLSVVLTIDEIKTARLIKIDVEGAEWNAVLGMVSIFSDCRVDLEIVVEVSRSMLQAQGKTIDDMLTLFATWGFKPYHVQNDYSESAYLNKATPVRPTRIESIPTGSADQFDLVFSRIDARSL